MARTLRPLLPGTHYFITANCSEHRFMLRPNELTTEWVAYWLARACRKHPLIVVHGVVVMSTHLHLVVADRGSSLSSFMAYFTGNLAKSLNRQLERAGHFFARRFASAPILDESAELERMVYLIDNPVKAGLVARPEDWPGLLLWASDGVSLERPVRAFDHYAYDRALNSTKRGPKPRREDFYVEETLHIAPVESWQDAGPAPRDLVNAIRADVRARSAEHAAARKSESRAVLGATRARSQDWRKAPPRLKKSPQPRSHAGDRRLSHAYRDWLRAMTGHYVEASVAFRAGQYDARFPDFTFRPHGAFAGANERSMDAAA